MLFCRIWLLNIVVIAQILRQLVIALLKKLRPTPYAQKY